eukprot:CAMPEP_0170426202 /NCGR_PEP_ID=MMETSP0117_2-20130122/38525_1 /TAXON_ID=400756 /ORGANISM="Durinskia baltica, Strain CSIRO CS-38" /LENGTH=41 /DNA_ID= /DNA_START= /DNA_END= /DNA_ORIENTATION=
MVADLHEPELKTAEELEQHFGTSVTKGLTSKQAEANLARDG